MRTLFNGQLRCPCDWLLGQNLLGMRFSAVYKAGGLTMGVCGASQGLVKCWSCNCEKKKPPERNHMCPWG